ncbi:MAG: ATP-binding cassette domain-containing protein [Acidobacteriaceae bacterium]|nr:ATP-binding cassette domain-containing protein [Acidobacteriaceae bacterium]
MNQTSGSFDLAFLSFQHVSYIVNGRTILNDVSFDVERGETLVLLGRSGSGKTTALRLINRLLELTDGSILLDGQEVGRMNPIELRRRIGYVIQEFGLLPHWSAEKNAALVPRLLGWSADRARGRARELLTQVGLDGDEIAAKKPHELSGGQRQRVAVARALAAEPALLLFDEPFGALDPVTRHEMQEQFIRLRETYKVTSVFVTHDLNEALLLGTSIAILDGGRLEALTDPQNFFKLQTPLATAFRNTLPPGASDRDGS